MLLHDGIGKFVIIDISIIKGNQYLGTVRQRAFSAHIGIKLQVME